MKKIILSVSVALAALTSTQVVGQVVAQEYTPVVTDYKPVAGDNTLELQLAPLGANPLSMGGVRFRHFMSATTAIRGTVYVGFMNETKITRQETAAVTELKEKNSSFELGIRPGIEKHLAGTNRLSPYIGAELDFALKTSSKKSEVGGIKGAGEILNNADNSESIQKNVTKNADGFTRFGLNAVFGADYYVAPKVFLGAELGFGFSVRKDAKQKFESANGGPVVETATGGSFVIAPNVLAQFRLGIVF